MPSLVHSHALVGHQAHVVRVAQHVQQQCQADLPFRPLGGVRVTSPFSRSTSTRRLTVQSPPAYCSNAQPGLIREVAASVGNGGLTDRGSLDQLSGRTERQTLKLPALVRLHDRGASQLAAAGAG